MQAVINWCDGEGKSFILDFIRRHDSTHSDVEEFLRRAKQK